MNLLKTIANDLEQFGYCEISGVTISTQESIILDQKSWGEEDEQKDFDFTTCPLWITCAEIEPTGFNSINDAANYIKDIV